MGAKPAGKCWIGERAVMKLGEVAIEREYALLKFAPKGVR